MNRNFMEMGYILSHVGCKLVYVHACMLSHFNHVGLFATLWTIAHQAPLSIGLHRQEYWTELLFPSSGDLPDLRIEPESPAASPLQVDSLLLSHRGSPYMHVHHAKCQTE